MKRSTTVGLILAITLILAISIATAASAAGVPSAKATAAVKNIAVVKAAPDTAWQPIMTKQLKTANQKDLLVDVSLECGLYTFTKVSSKLTGGVDTATAKAGVNVRVVIDPGDNQVVAMPAAPSTGANDPAGVTFCRRIQTMSAQLGQGIINCTSLADGTCTLEDQWVSLALDTMDANSFNFVAPNVSQGVHIIQVQAMIDPLTAEVTDITKATATLGWGSVTVEEVRMAKGDEALDMTAQ